MKTLFEEFMSGTRGYYSHGYFYINLSDVFDPDLSRLSKKELGTFFHEYVHFLQNITTLWGIQVGVEYNNAMCEIFTDTINASEIHIPFHPTFTPQTQHRLEYLGQINGCVSRDMKIDTSKRIGLSVGPTETQWQKPLQRFYLDVTYQNGQTEKIQLGAAIVAESMAALCQSLINPDADTHHDDIPYNVVQIIANQHFPHIAQDKKKLICICYMALFSLNPGWQLMDIMRYAEYNSDKSGLELFDKFVKTSLVRIGDKTEKLVDFFDAQIDKYILSIQGVLGYEPDYLKGLLNGVRLRQHAPLLLILDDEKPFGWEHVQALVDCLCVPFIESKYGFTVFPYTDQSPKGSMDVMELVCNYKMINFLTKPRKGLETICPFMSLCKHDHDKCYDEPWNEKGCLAATVMQGVGVSNKTVIID